jgi:hypothetical protein
MGALRFGLALVLSLQAAGELPRETVLAAPGPGLTWDEADTVARHLRRISRRLRSGRRASTETIVVTERELNSFVNLSLADKIPPEVSELQFHLGQNRLGARAVVDLDRLREKLPAGGPTLTLFMPSGSVPVELGGRVESAEGLARVELETVLVSGLRLPPSLIAEIVSFATRSEERPEGLDIAAPMALPWTARSVRLEPGRALVDFY